MNLLVLLFIFGCFITGIVAVGLVLALSLFSAETAASTREGGRE